MHCWADLQSVHEFHCYDNIHVCELIALYTENAYSAEREMSASACAVRVFTIYSHKSNRPVARGCWGF